MRTPETTLRLRTFRPLVAADCQRLIEQFAARLVPAHFAYKDERKVDEKIRTGLMATIAEPTYETQRFREEVAQATCEDLDRVENPQLLCYRNGDFFTRHQDGSFRQYTAVCFLSRAFEGGELFFPDYNVAVGPALCSTSIGSGIIFTGGAYHLSTPVERGEKWALVTWVRREGQ